MTHLKEGDEAPAIKGKDQNGNPVSLEKYKGKKIILYFYPKDNTPGCTAQACNLRDNYEDLIRKGYVVIGVSPDSEKSHQKFIEGKQLPFDLISDPEHTVLKDYGVWGEKKMYGKTYEGVHRTTFIISEEGIIEEIITKVKTKDHTKQILG
jgi:peroxiredoxin Q/BCP